MRTPPDCIASAIQDLRSRRKIIVSWLHGRTSGFSFVFCFFVFHVEMRKVKSYLKHDDGDLKAAWRINIQQMYMHAHFFNMASSLSSAAEPKIKAIVPRTLNLSK